MRFPCPAAALSNTLLRWLALFEGLLSIKRKRERKERKQSAKSAAVRTQAKCIQGQRGAWPGVEGLKGAGKEAQSHREEFLLARSARAGHVLLGRLGVLKGKRRMLQAQTCRVGAGGGCGQGLGSRAY